MDLYLKEYDFDIIHKASKVDWDANGLNWNLKLKPKC
jgi:hypothetical protein